MKTKPDIVLVGAGNLATQLGITLRDNGFPVVCVYSRTSDSAATLGKRLHVPYTNNLADIPSDAGIYIFSVKDDALPGLLEIFPSNQGLWVHTAGSIPLSIFENYADRYGVVYPLQTFSKNRDVSFGDVPVFVEANNDRDNSLLLDFARGFSKKVVPLSSEKRKYYHLAAVFACNFSNHMYTLASEILDQQDLDWKFLQALIRETAAKIEDLSPADAQTGPAIRYDLEIINKQLELLQGDEIKQELYEKISYNIHNRQQIS
ncbi:MAG: DUF2520 domain-containing protein [Dysgonamonadaceae bacterium]|jgi:predicted short-subunit dehydrogenase-like oxidoreductase (DUF2520 family)|nr:DUF2520 domain-containing protein [Dysgonamonadaceae bacterium]